MQVEFQQISKSFPGVRALENVSFQVAPGSCHALLGENGAGKSTLGKILAGLQTPDSGQILLDGRATRLDLPRAALAAGVGIVHQELVFCPELSIAENLGLHDLPHRGPRIDWSMLHARAETLLRRVGLEESPWTRVGDLPIAKEQLVQIAAAVGLGARVLVFDEPTSSLGRAETQRLFSLIRELQRGGTTILYVSHRLEEIFELCDTVTVLRDGRHIATCPTQELDAAGLVKLMVGRAIEPVPLPAPPSPSQVPLLQVRQLSLPGRFRNIDLELHAGEIVGLAGLGGAGRTSLGETIAGLHPEYTGVLRIDGTLTRLRSPREALRRGIGLIPEDRKQQGLVLPLGVRQNSTLSIVDRLRGWLGRLREREEIELASQARSRLKIRAPDIDTPVHHLSGGNQQKVVFARGTLADCRLLVVDEPTRGVDIGAKREIHELLVELAGTGTAIVLISSDLPELLTLSHRVVVLHQGGISARLERAELSEEIVARAMTGLPPRTK
ncbi:MAG: sugar ABC transporter ATP-binding protein [Planctomycetaceae bacterium]